MVVNLAPKVLTKHQMHVAIEALEEIVVTIEIVLERMLPNMMDPLLKIDIQASLTTLFGFLHRVRVLL